MNKDQMILTGMLVFCIGHAFVVLRYLRTKRKLGFDDKLSQIAPIFLIFMTLVFALVAPPAYPQEKDELIAKFMEAYDLHSQIIGFQSVHYSKLKKIEVEFSQVDFDERTEASCGETDDGQPKIRVNLFRWEADMPGRREAVLFHELGHCVLRREHRTGEIDFGGEIGPISLMNPKGVNWQLYQKHRDYYLDELFNTK